MKMIFRNFLILLLLSIGICANAQEAITAPNLAINNAGSKDLPLNWQPIHKMADTQFRLTWLKDGNITMQYKSSEQPEIYEKIEVKSDGKGKIRLSFGSFSFAGLYQGKNDPEGLYHAIYIDSKLKNSVIVTSQIAFDTIIAASYFSDLLENPLEKGKIQIVTIDVNKIDAN